MNRRRFLRTVGVGAGAAGLAGCTGGDGDGENESGGDGNESTGGESENESTGGEDGESEGDDENATGENDTESATDEDATGDESGEENETNENETESGDEELSGTLRVATYTSLVDGEDPAGVWLKEAFEEQYPETTIEWTVPEAGVNHYVQRVQQGAAIEADVYFGLNVDDLVRIDDTLEESLFVTLERDRVERVDTIRDDPAVEFGDPDDRVLPYDTGYITLVYDENEVDGPGTFEALTESAYEGTLLAQNAQSSDPGRAFLLWTIDAYGEDGYLDYWRRLADNDVRILGSWDDAYSAYENGERPMVVSYSTDQVYTNRYDGDMSRSQVAFLEGQGYANPEGMAIFEESEQGTLAYAFMDFVLSGEAQAEIAVRNVQFPAVADEHVDLDAEYDEYALEPEESIALGYDELQGSLGTWVDDWAREIASQ